MTQMAEYARWRNDPEGYWLDAANAISWLRRPIVACDHAAKPAARWFPDGITNACHNAVDRHVEAGFGAQAALVHVSAMTGSERTFTYAELQHEVAHVAGALRRLGVAAGDRVVMLPDGNGDLTRALGLEMDGSAFGLGKRSQRFALYAEDGIVKDLQIEKPGAYEVSSAEAMLARV